MSCFTSTHKLFISHQEQVVRTTSIVSEEHQKQVQLKILPEEQPQKQEELTDQMAGVTAIEIPQWIQDNQGDFVPPVCNKCMFSDQLKVFYVGGPNQRKDFHLEEGEEFFFQRKGDMVLKVIEKGQVRDLVIKQGEMFMLPARVEHSPQRFANSIGLVVERERKNTEFDCVRFLVGSSNVTLFERWFFLTDVVKDLPPLIKEFYNSNEFKTGKPGKGTFACNAPYEARWTDLPVPINRKEFIYDHISEVKNGPLKIYGAPEYKTEVMLLGEGSYDLEAGAVELIIWLQENTFAVVEESGFTYALKSETMVRIKPNTKCLLNVKGGFAITIRMPG
ncbi:hypothetical protein B9Z55_020221 [Caenorhabditis nigoni]|uniref:3-hydroxyanthranilate 3,4-dioxygenase n=1 Tax=Caenorhabditis nigoni TaxID=1611254 RepID=A0A2G5TMI7_9PELO|nr:hypothetical protein B9Z55_020221 [Caenorhabditis nigoni]